MKKLAAWVKSPAPPSEPAASASRHPTSGSARASERVTCAEPPRGKKKSADSTLPRAGAGPPRSRRRFQRDSPATCTVRFSSARKEVEGKAPSPLPLAACRPQLAPARRCREQRPRRNLAQDELVVAKQRRCDRGDRGRRSVERRQVLLLDRALNLDQPLRDLPLRLDRTPKVSRLRRGELSHERRCDRCRH